MHSNWYFLECEICGFRFPLDLSVHQGRFCPKCGGKLKTGEPRLAQNSDKPPESSFGALRLAGLLDNIRSAQNIGAIFRSADGAGFERLFMTGITPTPASVKEIGKTALGAEERLPWKYFENSLSLARGALEDGWKLLVLEESPKAESIFRWQKPDEWQKLILAVGNEQVGVDPSLLALADKTLYLPMLGSKGSLNVASAFSIAAYTLRFR